MAFLLFLAVLNVFIFQAGAAQEEDIASFDGEIQRREEAKRSSDITSLLSKLISDMEGIKGQILSEMPEQLEKQSEEMKTMANDIKNVKELITTQVTKTIAKLSEDLDAAKKRQDEQAKKLAKDLEDIKDRFAKQEDETKNSKQHLKKIETSVSNGTRQFSESLRLHDQRLQNLSNEVFCKRSESLIPKDCSDIRRLGSTTSGVYRISLNNKLMTDVYCDFDTPGGDWLVFQRRRDGSVDFYRNWASYANGFGNANWEFWLGNNIIHQLTSTRRYKLRVDLEDFENQKRYAEYSSFSIGPSSDYYRLKIGSYTGNAGDALTYHNNTQFSTNDVDRDQWPGGSSAQEYHGAWWYSSGFYSSLNGKFFRGAHTSYAKGVDWYHWRGHYYSLKSEMKIALAN